MSFTVIIPSRYGSTRLPGKPLLEIGGKPMVQHVWERCQDSAASRVLIATDDERIRATAEQFGAEVCMTSARHPSGTDRLQEVVEQLGLGAEEIVVNVQGDEPMIPPMVVDQVAGNLAGNAGVGMATLCGRIDRIEEFENPNIVKVVCSESGLALYFSRAPIPWPRDAFSGGRRQVPVVNEWRRHIGIYAYRCGFLHDFIRWAPAPIEQAEQLEQLRALYHGAAIHIAEAVCPVPAGVDTAEDLEHVRRLIAGV